MNAYRENEKPADSGIDRLAVTRAGEAQRRASLGRSEAVLGVTLFLGYLAIGCFMLAGLASEGHAGEAWGFFVPPIVMAVIAWFARRQRPTPTFSETYEEVQRQLEAESRVPILADVDGARFTPKSSSSPAPSEGPQNAE